jgi:hypothetical protein
MLSERDYVLRLAKQLAEAVARALKLSREAKPGEAASSLVEACSSTLGIEHRVLSMLDARSAVELLGEPERVAAYVQLVEAMADVEGKPALRLRALELCDEGLARSRSADLEALRARLGARRS